MTDEANDMFAPAIGDNQPPAVLPELMPIDEIVAILETTHSAELTRCKEILEKGARHLTITNDAEDEAATQFLNSVRALWKLSEANRVSEKDPYYQRDAAIHGWFKSNILDPIALNTTKQNERFDPVTRTDLGIGPRITMAMTLYKADKLEKERNAREAEAQRLRDIEAAAAKKRREEEAAARAIEDKRRADAAAEAKRIQDEADRLALEASRKRNADNKAAAEAAAAEARKAAAEAAERRRAADEQAERERQEREAAARDEENRLAQDRASAEAAANAKAADMTRARGGKGGTSSLKEFVNFRDANRAALDYAALGPYFKEEHLSMAIKAYADANKATVQQHLRAGTQPLKGVIFFMDTKSASRT